LRESQILSRDFLLGMLLKPDHRHVSVDALSPGGTDLRSDMGDRAQADFGQLGDFPHRQPACAAAGGFESHRFQRLIAYPQVAPNLPTPVSESSLSGHV